MHQEWRSTWLRSCSTSCSCPWHEKSLGTRCDLPSIWVAPWFLIHFSFVLHFISAHLRVRPSQLMCIVYNKLAVVTQLRRITQSALRLNTTTYQNTIYSVSWKPIKEKKLLCTYFSLVPGYWFVHPCNFTSTKWTRPSDFPDRAHPSRPESLSS